MDYSKIKIVQIYLIDELKKKKIEQELFCKKKKKNAKDEKIFYSSHSRNIQTRM